MDRYCIQHDEAWRGDVPENRKVTCPKCGRPLTLRFRGRVVAGQRTTEWYLKAHLKPGAT